MEGAARESMRPPPPRTQSEERVGPGSRAARSDEKWRSGHGLRRIAMRAALAEELEWVEA
jgi:hypothetical protein